MKQLTVLDLFAGCGGLSIGLEQAGLDVRWANEYWPAAAQTYTINHPRTAVFQDDAKNLLRRMLEGDPLLPKRGDVDVVVGGPPCQGFSGVNRFRDFDDPRNSLVETFFDIVKVLHPRFVVMENVAGILTLEHGRAVHELLASLGEIGYNADLFVLQAGAYGVAQTRWRVFVLASRDTETQLTFPAPMHAFPRNRPLDVGSFKSKIIHAPLLEGESGSSILPYVTVGNAIGDLPEIGNGGSYSGYYDKKPSCAWQEIIRDGSVELTDHDTIKLGEENLKRLAHLPFKPGAGWLDLPKDLQPRNLAKLGVPSYNYRFGRLHWAGYFTTIPSKPEPYWGRFFHPEQQRIVSVRECARAQGFPDTFRFSGPLRARYAQVGNAVPPPLGRAIGWEIRRAAGDKMAAIEENAYRRQIQA
jgi:DNA (cytosine-5)-methyltransferase 1